MSRIYHDQALQSPSTHNVAWPSAWTGAGEGDGMIVEIVVRGKSKAVVTDSRGEKSRHIIIHGEVQTAYQRRFEGGREVDVAALQTQKVRTGFLNSSYKDEKVRNDLLTAEEVRGRVRGFAARLPRAGSLGQVDFWGTEEMLKDLDIENGTRYRLKTRGDSPFIETLLKMDVEPVVKAANQAGDKAAGDSWTTKIMAQKAPSGPAALPQDNLEGVGDDEWD
eukprot:m.236383 g.236383  ORF g.236383 m.236383 type:complete len:221 (-) comp20587_c0_seq1:66-728(-)